MAKTKKAEPIEKLLWLAADKLTSTQQNISIVNLPAKLFLNTCLTMVFKPQQGKWQIQKPY